MISISSILDYNSNFSLGNMKDVRDYLTLGTTLGYQH